MQFIKTTVGEAIKNNLLEIGKVFINFNIGTSDENSITTYHKAKNTLLDNDEIYILVSGNYVDKESSNQIKELLNLATWVPNPGDSVWCTNYNQKGSVFLDPSNNQIRIAIFREKGDCWLCDAYDPDVHFPYTGQDTWIPLLNEKVWVNKHGGKKIEVFGRVVEKPESREIAILFYTRSGHWECVDISDQSLYIQKIIE